MGKYQGLMYEDFISNEDVKSCFVDYNLRLNGGESINELNARIKYFLLLIGQTSQFDRIAIITHSAVISNIKAYLTNEKYQSLSECELNYKNNNLYVKKDMKKYK